MTAKPQTLSLALSARTRQPLAPRPRRSEYRVPNVRKDEVAIAAGILGNYEIDGNQAITDEQIEVLEAFALTSRNNAYALVQIAWAFATVEKDHFGEKRWFFDSWMPEMKGAQENGEQMAETEQGVRVRLNRAERNVLIRSIGPMFGTGLSDALVDAVCAAIVGKCGTHIAMSLEILRVLNGLDSINQVVKVIKAEAAASPAPEAAEEESDDSAEVEDVPEEDIAQSA